MNARWFDDLSGKSAVITGGAGVIGSAMASCLAENGVKTAILDLKSDLAEQKAKEIAKATGGTCIGVGGNVLDKVSLADSKKAINDLCGPIDILINAAGGNSPKATTAVETIEDKDLDHLDQTFFGLEMDAFRKVFDLNFIGTFFATQVFARGMVAKGKGSIVNISSMGAFMPLTKVAAYSAAKAAVSNFTRWLAVHFSHVGIRVNALAPGFFMTEQLRFLHIDPKTGELLPRARQVIAHTPMGRYGVPDDLIGALVWLLSDASGFVTGVVVPVDGGFSSYSI